MHDRRTPIPAPEPPCDGCGRQGVSYRLTLTSILRPAAQRHKHYCVSCWLVIREQVLDQEAKEPTHGQ